MNAKRKEEILKILAAASGPTSASALASRFNVSRQVIVGDISILRAEDNEIISTSKGYVYNKDDKSDFGYVGIVASKHDNDGLVEEMYTVVDFGGTVIDVLVEHAIYGRISGRVGVSSRYEVDQFVQKMEADSSVPLTSLTDGHHLHQIGCKDKQTFALIAAALKEKGLADEGDEEDDE